LADHCCVGEGQSSACAVRLRPPHASGGPAAPRPCTPAVMQVSREMEIRDGTAATTKQSMRAALLGGVVVGGIQAASPLAVWWLTPATVYALELALIAAVYIGFAVADGRRQVIAVECCVAA